MSQPVTQYVNALGNSVGAGIAPTGVGHEIGNTLDTLNPFNGDTSKQTYVVATGVNPNQKGVYWLGSNGHYYVKANDVSGVQDAGIRPNTNLFAGLTKIADPNPTGGNTAVLGANTGSVSYGTPGVAAMRSQIASQGQNALQQARDFLTSSNQNALSAYNQSKENAAENLRDAQAANKNTQDQATEDYVANASKARMQGRTNYSALVQALLALGSGLSPDTQRYLSEITRQQVGSNLTGANATREQNLRSADQAYGQAAAQNDSDLQKGEKAYEGALASNTAKEGDYVNSIQQALAALGTLDSTSDPSYLGEDIRSIVSSIPTAVNYDPGILKTALYAAPALSKFSLTPNEIALATGSTPSMTVPYLTLPFKKKQQSGRNVPTLVPAYAPATA